jgi:hypothetical protein
MSKEHSQPKQIISAATVNSARPLSAEEQRESVIYSYARVNEFGERHWIRKSEPESKVRYALLSSLVKIGKGSTLRCAFSVDVFVPSLASDPTTKMLVEVRTRETGRAPSGEVIHPGFMFDAWRWCEEFVPDRQWMTSSEWQTILDELAPTIARDKAWAAADNPTGHLAAGIAAGVAQALASLGIEPKQRKAL